MAYVGIRGTAYCLNHASELGLHYGTTPWQERVARPDSPFLGDLAARVPGYDVVSRYAPNLAYIGALDLPAFAAAARPCMEHLAAASTRYGRYGEIMPEDEFLALLDICDVFDLIWLEKEFAAAMKTRLEAHPVVGPSQLARLEAGHEAAEIDRQIREERALPLYCGGRIAGCCRRGHEVDENLSAHVLLENIASKAGAVLSLLHLIRNAGLTPNDIDFVVDCSEEAAGDVNQRGGGNMAKAIAESAGCSHAGGFDVRAFCAAPVAAIITSAAMVAAGVRRNVAVVSGGSIPKLFMNAREHLKKNVPPLECCLGGFAVLLGPDDGRTPAIRLDAIGKHSVSAGASPQAVTTALVYEPLTAAGLDFNDVDVYAPELHDPEITLPAGAGNVPEANYKMIAALAVMKGRLERSAIADFVAAHGVPGFAPTQGHIPSGVPILGHVVDAIREGRMRRAMLIGKGSLFLGRLTNLADGASFLVEMPATQAAAAAAAADAADAADAAGAVDAQDVRAVLLDVLEDMAERLKR